MFGGLCNCSEEKNRLWEEVRGNAAGVIVASYMCGNDRNRKFIKDELGKEHEYIVTIAEGLIKKQGKNRTVTPLTGTVITSDYNSPASFSNTTDSGGSAQSR